MTGISEILILVLLITCVLILPRLFKGEPDKKRSSKKIKNLSAKLRLNIVLTLAYPMVMALILKPWKNDLILFLTYGIAPVIFVWAVIWIMAGKAKKQ